MLEFLADYGKNEKKFASIETFLYFCTLILIYST